MSSEPWRFECPECGSVSLYPRSRADGYRCDACGWTGGAGERVDRKAVATSGA